MAKVVSDAETPKGWLRVWEAKEDSLANAKNGSHSFDLCSLLCVEKWAKGRRRFLAGDAPRRDFEGRKKVLEALGLVGSDTVTVKTIAELTEMTENAARHHVLALTTQGVLECVQTGKPNRPGTYRVIDPAALLASTA
jgi:hypothetical protein